MGGHLAIVGSCSFIRLRPLSNTGSLGSRGQAGPYWEDVKQGRWRAGGQRAIELNAPSEEEVAKQGGLDPGGHSHHTHGAWNQEGMGINGKPPSER